MALSGKLVDRGGEARVLLTDAEHVMNDNRQVENDHSYLMCVGGQEVWLRKADMKAEEGEKEISISVSHARDMFIDIGGDTRPAKDEEKGLTASMGLNSAAPSATQNPNKPKQAGESKDKGG